jgi:hypothetical protein
VFERCAQYRGGFLSADHKRGSDVNENGDREEGKRWFANCDLGREEKAREERPCKTRGERMMI